MSPAFISLQSAKKLSSEAFAAPAIKWLASLWGACGRQFMHLPAHIGQKQRQGARLLEFGLQSLEFRAQFRVRWPTVDGAHGFERGAKGVDRILDVSNIGALHRMAEIG
ncbi:MAG: hypothetical protein J7498_06485 [Sphingobium sp.]|nr:hypothetical protein [Sphingobium sp.]